MAIRHDHRCRENIAVELYAFFEPHGTTDQGFDEICGWVPGTTRELLEKIRFPSETELLEICLRLDLPLSGFLQAYMPDAPPTWEHPVPRRCTPQDPCCPRRLEQWDSLAEQKPIDCPRNCLCHT